jgi:hypothetical protein
MKIKPTSAYEHIGMYYILNMVNLLHVRVSTTLLAIHGCVFCKGCITKTSKSSALKFSTNYFICIIYFNIHFKT